MFVSDLYETMTAIFWGATTIYIKKYVVAYCTPAPSKAIIERHFPEA
jgi:hypothetical protein